MAKNKPTDKAANLELYLQRLQTHKPEDLIPPATNPTIAQLLAEGHKLLEADAKFKDVPQSVPIIVKPVSNTNPYVKARQQLFEKYAPWRKNEVLHLEKIKDLDNQHYLTYVKEVIELGNYLSNNPEPKTKTK